MVNRFKKAFSALLVILLITLGCLAFMPWRMSEVIPELSDVQKCVVMCYDGGTYTTAYPKDEVLTRLLEAMGPATGHFDRKRTGIRHKGNAPLYRVYFWDSQGLLPEVWVCSTQFFYNNSQFVLDDGDALRLSAALHGCFG